MEMKRLVSGLCVATMLAAAPAVAGSDIDRKPGTSSIADIVAASPDHTVLEFALGAAGLDTVLDDPEVRLTVFAPTDAAFAKAASELGFASVGDLAQHLVASGTLEDVLLYHVTDGRRFSNSVINRNRPKPIETLLGQYVTSTPSGRLVDGEVATSDATITIPNIAASNGVVHVIDNVLVP
jgi:uncharacterized surface protein with fasciclin (FAS1) repeats